MSADWIYDANLEDTTSLIAKIFCDKHQFPGRLRLYPWFVKLKSGEVFGLYLADEKDYLFSAADKQAIENAMINAMALRVATSLRQIQEVDRFTKCSKCCIF